MAEFAGCRWDLAAAIAGSCVARLQPYCRQVEIAGAVRRKAPTVKTLELVCVPKYDGMALFGDAPDPDTNQLLAFLRRCESEKSLIPVGDMKVGALTRTYHMPGCSIKGLKLTVYMVNDIASAELEYPGIGQKTVTPKFVQGSATSRAAAETARGRMNLMHKRVLRALADAGAAGLTDYEIQCRLAMGGNTERPRRIELVENYGLVAAKPDRSGGGQEKRVVVDEDGKKRRAAGVWVLAEYADAKVGV